MWFVYILAFLSIAVGLFLFLYKKEIDEKEFALGSALAIFTAVIFHFVSYNSLTRDYETWSTTLDKAVHFPYWHEYYTTQEPVYSTDSKGNSYVSHYRTVHHHIDHPEHWTAFYSIGAGKHFTDGEFEISESKFREIVFNFSGGEIVTETPYKSNFDHGDKNIYVANQRTGYVYPVAIVKRFKNKLKASPSLFDFAPVPEDIDLWDWPETHEVFESNRLLGRAEELIDIREFDLLNSRIGPVKKVNLIMVGFEESEPLINAQYLRSKWIGGKKNDLVICFGGGSTNEVPSWSYVFGWTDEEIVKKNIQTILLTNTVSNDILPLIESEVRQNYQIKEWRDFDYLEVPIPTWLYWVYPLFLIGTQSGLYYYFHGNNPNVYKRRIKYTFK